MTEENTGAVSEDGVFEREEIIARLERLGLRMPEPKEAVGNYKPGVIHGNLLYVSGHGPWLGDFPIIGKVGVTMSADEGQFAAQVVALGILATVDKLVGFQRIDRLVESFGLVNASTSFTSHPAIIDGYSDVMAAAFGSDRGVGARTAIGVSSLPYGIPVEVKCIFALRDDKSSSATAVKAWL